MRLWSLVGFDPHTHKLPNSLTTNSLIPSYYNSNFLTANLFVPFFFSFTFIYICACSAICLVDCIFFTFSSSFPHFPFVYFLIIRMPKMETNGRHANIHMYVWMHRLVSAIHIYFLRTAGGQLTTSCQPRTHICDYICLFLRLTAPALLAHLTRMIGGDNGIVEEEGKCTHTNKHTGNGTNTPPFPALWHNGMHRWHFCHCCCCSPNNNARITNINSPSLLFYMCCPPSAMFLLLLLFDVFPRHTLTSSICFCFSPFAANLPTQHICSSISVGLAMNGMEWRWWNQSEDSGGSRFPFRCKYFLSDCQTPNSPLISTAFKKK